MKATLLLLSKILTLMTLTGDGNPDKVLFTVTTQNAEVKEMTQTSVTLRSEHDAYFIKLEPQRPGNVIFSLSDIGYSSTAKIPDLAFQVKITGFKENKEVYPLFGLDDINEHIIAEGNILRFQRIRGAVPVWFTEPVDSVNLEYSNSHRANVHQFLRIQDLRVVDPLMVLPNPAFSPCRENRIMVAVDGSSSMDKKERKQVGREFIDFVRESEETPDTNTFSILEYGTGVTASMTSTDSREIVQAMRDYKRRKHKPRRTASFTNWSAAFDKVISEKPDLFIFITDGWSNWQGGQPVSFTAIYPGLVNQCNAIKANGTRIMFILSGMQILNSDGSVLSTFVNGEHTVSCSVTEEMTAADMQCVDIFHLGEFSMIDQLPLSSLLSCNEQEAEPRPKPVKKGKVQDMVLAR